MATRYEVAVAEALPGTDELAKAHQTLLDLSFAVNDRSRQLKIEDLLTGTEIDSLVEQISDVLRGPLGADLLLVILPRLVDVSIRGRAEAARPK